VAGGILWGIIRGGYSCDLGIPRFKESKYFYLCPSRAQEQVQEFSPRWEPFGSSVVFHFAMVKLMDILHVAKELRNSG
jgi:hypothetical protein